MKKTNFSLFIVIFHFSLLIFFVPLTFHFSLFTFHFNEASAALISKPPTNLGLVGYWSMNEGTGSYAGDSSGNKNTGTLTNGPTWVDGKRGKALNFDGSNDFVKTTYTGGLNDFTACAWFKDDGVVNGTHERIIDKSYQNGFWIGRNNTVTNSWGGGVLEAVSPYGRFVTLSDGVWHHICSKREGTTHTIIGDGGAVSTSGTVANTVLDSTAVRIGIYHVENSGQFGGLIDEARVYNRALSAAEIQALYNSGAATVGKTTKIHKDITLNALTSGSQYNTDPSTTASITPGANRLILAVVATNNTMDAPTLSGNGLTWVQITTVNRGGGRRVTLYRAMGTSPSSGAVTIDFPSGTPNEVRWSIVEFGNVDTSGSNGSGAVVQSATNTGAATGGLTVTLSAFKSSNNATYGTVMTESSATITEGSGFTEIHDEGNNLQLQTQYKFSADTTVDWTWPPNENSSGIAIEIKKKPVSVALNSSQNSKLTNGLVGMWSFNGPDMSGVTAYDRSGQGNNGTITNGPSRVAGKVGQALNFDGSDDYVRRATLSGTPQSTMTISAWIKTGGTSLAYIVQNNRSPTSYQNEFIFMMGADGTITFWDYATSAYGFATTQYSTRTVNNNTWKHVAFVKNGTSGRYYIDGVADASPTAAADVTYGSNDFVIGKNYRDNNAFFNGLIDEVRVYNRALSPDEVKRLYNMGR